MTATVEQLKLWSLLASSCGAVPMTPFLEKFAHNARADLILELAAKQAEIDALMLEFCPERMAPEHIDKQIECGMVNEYHPHSVENNPYQSICKTVADEFGVMLCDESLTAYDANILQAKVTGAMQCYVRIGDQIANAITQSS